VYSFNGVYFEVQAQVDVDEGGIEVV